MKMSLNTKCQVFTPSEYAKNLLTYVNYREKLFGKKIAENSCGDGNILIEIVECYINSALDDRYSLDEIKTGLEEDIWAAEIDDKHISICKTRLNNVIDKYGISGVCWNIYLGDFLKLGFENKFDFIIGNPPYITYKELKEDDRKYLKEAFTVCGKGKFDYCYAFIEASIKALKAGGQLAYLIPSNIFKNRFASSLREYICPHITDIYDYTSKKLFSGKPTASAIVICRKDNGGNSVLYHDINQNTSFTIQKDRLALKWMFTEETSSDIEIVRFGDYFHTASAVATLFNKAYILSDYLESDSYIETNNCQIEKSLLRQAMSPRSINYNKSEYLVFPYYYDETGLQRYSPAEFERLFPKGTLYLKNFINELKNRKSDPGISWFEYGRSQALHHLNQEKLLMSTLITGKVKVNTVDVDTIPTSGLYIVKKPDNDIHTLMKAEEILKSDAFLRYVSKIGVISNVNSFRISSKDINNYTFPVSQLN